MPASQRRARRIRVDTAPWPIPALVDRVLDTYVEWREATYAVADTYGRWRVAPKGEEVPRFAAYMAALDQEETAAAVYAQSIDVLGRRLPDPGGSRL
jgi:hypothetical protein